MAIGHYMPKDNYHMTITGNQLDGVHLEWEDVKGKYFARYGMSLPFWRDIWTLLL